MNNDNKKVPNQRPQQEIAMPDSSSLELPNIPVRSQGDGSQVSVASRQSPRRTIERMSVLRAAIIIAVLALLIGGVVLFLQARKANKAGLDTKAQIPSQSVDVGSSAGMLPVIQGASNAVIFNNQVILRSNLVIQNNQYGGSIKIAGLTGDQSYTLPNASGTFCLDSNNCGYATQAQLAETLQQTVNGGTTLLGGSGVVVANNVVTNSGVLSVNGMVSAINIQGTANQVTVTNANGTVSLALQQDIGVASVPKFAGLTLTSIGTQNGNIICDQSNNCGYGGGVNALLQGGNSFSNANVVVGATDAGGVSLLAGGQERLKISGGGQITLGNSAANSVVFQSSTIYAPNNLNFSNTMYVDTTNRNVAIGAVYGVLDGDYSSSAPKLYVQTGSSNGGILVNSQGADGQLNSPFSVAYGEFGFTNRMYVADTGNNRIQMFTGGVYFGQFGKRGDSDTQFNSPTGVAVDNSTQEVYVVEYAANRVKVYDMDGNFLRKFGTPGSGNGQFNGSLNIAIDSNHRLYVTDLGNSRVQVFDSSGNYLRQFGTPGSGNGQFSAPFGVAVDSNANLTYVTDLNDDRVQVFDSSGNYLRQFGTPGSGNGQFNGPTGIAVNSSNGQVYVTDLGNSRVQVFDSSGNYLRQFGTPGSGNGQFNSPYGITISIGGNVIVADTYNNRVQTLNSVGTMFSQIAQPVPTQAPLLSLANNGQNFLDITNDGRFKIQGVVPATDAFRIVDPQGYDLFAVDSLNKVISLGASAYDATVLRLGGKFAPTDPVGTPGSMYYNVGLNKFRCFNNTSWIDCGGSSGAGTGDVNNGGNSYGGAMSVGTLDNSALALLVNNYTVARFTSNGMIFQSPIDNVNSFWVQNAAGSTALSVDTINNKLKVTGGINVGGKPLRIYSATNQFVSAYTNNAPPITTSVDIQVRIKPVHWDRQVGIMADKNGVADKDLWYFALIDSKLSLAYTSDGINNKGTSSSLAVPFIDGQTGWVRATLNTTNGNITYYTAPDSLTSPTVWTQLGVVRTTTAGTIFDDGTGIVNYVTGPSTPFTPAIFNSKDAIDDGASIFSARVLNGIGGVLKVSFNPTDASSVDSASWVSSATGETWTPLTESAGYGYLGYRLLGESSSFSGFVGIGTTTPTNMLTVNNPSTSDALAQVLIASSSVSDKGLVIQGYDGQFSDLLQIQSADGAVINSMAADGSAYNLGTYSSPYGGFGKYSNLLASTEAFDDTTNWVRSSGTQVVADNVIAPNGTQTADTITSTVNGGALSQVSTASTTANGGSYTFSVWLRSTDGNSHKADLRLTSSVPSLFGIHTVTVTPEWQRFSETVDTSAMSGTVVVIIMPGTSSGIGEVAAWGAQLEPSTGTASPGAYVSNGSVIPSLTYGPGLVTENAFIKSNFYAATGTINRLSVGSSSSFARLSVFVADATSVGVGIRGASGQAADLLQAQDSAGTVLASIGASGNLTINSGASINMTPTDVSFVGGTSSKVTTPNTPANTITSDIDIRAKVKSNGWDQGTIIGKQVMGGNISYTLGISASKLVFRAINGPTNRMTTSSVVTGLSPYSTSWVRVTRDATTGTVMFYLSSDGITWNILGSPQASIPGALGSDSASLAVGNNAASNDPFLGAISYAAVYNGINGTLAASFNPADAPTSNVTSWVSTATGETWTIVPAGGASLTGAKSQISVTTAASTNKGLIIQAVSGQSANLQEWQDSTGQTLGFIGPNGNASFSGLQLNSSAPLGQYLRGDGTSFTASLLQSADLNGLVDVSKGGTNNGTYTINGVLYYDGTKFVSTAAPTTGQCLIGTSTTPIWGSCAGVPGGGSGDINSGGNSFGGNISIGTTDNYGVGIIANGTSVATFSNSGQALFQNSSDSATAFRIQNATGVSLLTVDSTNSRLYIGDPTPDATGTLLVLDSKNTAGDPVGVDGAMYYNTIAKKFRCYQGGLWVDCIFPAVSVSKTANQAVSAVSYADVSDLSFNVQANQKYKLQCSLVMSSVGSGGLLSMTGPASPTQYTASFTKTTNLGAGDRFATSSSYDDAGVTNVSTVSTGSNRFILTYDATLINGASAGIWQLRSRASAVGSNLTFYNGSSCVFTPL